MFRIESRGRMDVPEGYQCVPIAFGLELNIIGEEWVPQCNAAYPRRAYNDFNFP